MPRRPSVESGAITEPDFEVPKETHVEAPAPKLHARRRPETSKAKPAADIEQPGHPSTGYNKIAEGLAFDWAQRNLGDWFTKKYADALSSDGFLVDRKTGEATNTVPRELIPEEIFEAEIKTRALQIDTATAKHADLPDSEIGKLKAGVIQGKIERLRNFEEPTTAAERKRAVELMQNVREAAASPKAKKPSARKEVELTTPAEEPDARAAFRPEELTAIRTSKEKSARSAPEMLSEMPAGRTPARAKEVSESIVLTAPEMSEFGELTSEQKRDILDGMYNQLVNENRLAPESHYIPSAIDKAAPSELNAIYFFLKDVASAAKPIEELLATAPDALRVLTSEKQMKEILPPLPGGEHRGPLQTPTKPGFWDRVRGLFGR